MSMVQSGSQGSGAITGWVRPTEEEVARASRMITPDLGPRYVFRDYLGSGAFATVWRAHDVVAGVDVAVKRFHAPAEKCRGFYREMNVLFRLNHPGIVRIINLQESKEGTRYLILEHCAGGNLRRSLSRARREGQTCPPQRAASLALQLARALACAHAQGVVHRDVKPENILFSQVRNGPFGGDSPVKLADFGLARFLQQNLVSDQLSRLSGSPAYMAPEQFQGTYREASDLYALGVVLHELLLGRPPFAGTAEELAYQHLRIPPPAFELPEPWPRWLTSLLDKDPSQRVQLEDWIAQLEQSVAPPPPPASPAGTKESTPMHDLSRDQLEALDRDLDRLQSALAALSGLKLGKRPGSSGSITVEEFEFPETVVHPVLDQLIAWNGGEAEVEPEPKTATQSTPYPGILFSTPAFPQQSSLPEDRFPAFEGEEDTPRGRSRSAKGDSAHVETPMEEDPANGGTVEALLRQFDWR